MKKFTSEEIRSFVSKPLFDEKIILNKDPSWPKISIVTPSYNQAQFLERTILSVLNQNYPNLEYIIIDGASTDGTVEIIKKYEKYLTYWVSEKDNGQAHALNKGFRLCNGAWLGWQNSDDVYMPGAFLDFVRYANKLNQKYVFYSDCAIIDYDDNIMSIKPNIPPNPLYASYRSMILGNQACFFSKRVTDEAGFIDEQFQFAMDRDFFLRILLRLGKNKFHYANSIWGAFRKQDRSKTSGSNQKRWEEEQRIISSKYGFDHNNFNSLFTMLSIISRGWGILANGKIIPYLKYKYTAAKNKHFGNSITH